MEIQTEIQRDRIESDSRKTELQGKVKSNIKTASSSNNAENVGGNNGGVKAKVASVLKATAAIGAVASNMISTAMPGGSDDDLSSNTASEFREKTGKIADKSFSAVKDIAQRKIKNLQQRGNTPRSPARAKIKRKIVSSIDNTRLGHGLLNTRNRVKGIKKRVAFNINKIKRTVIKSIDTNKVKKRTSKVGKAAGTAVRGVSGAVGTVSRVKLYTSGDDAGNNLAEMGKDIAAKGADLSFRATKKVLKKPAKAITKQVKKVGKRALKTAVNKVQKKLAKKTAKTAAKATQRTLKTTVNVAKATAKIVANAAKVAAHAIKAAIQAAVQAAQAVGEAVVTLLATPVGWIILAVVLVVVLIVILFNMLSGAATVPVSTVSSVGSSLSWLFGGDDNNNSNNNDMAELYSGFEEKAHTAMTNAKNYYQGQISGISFGDRDTLVFNGASFYPASAADDYVQDYFDNLDYDDYKYLMEMCYIKKLRDERTAQGLSENDLPEVTIDENDIKDFLLTYCYSFNIDIIGGQACPTLDCCSRTSTSTSYCGGGDDCSNHDDDGECLGHDETTTTYYCDHSHIKAIVTLQEIPKDELENDILVLTDDEREMLDLGLQILNEGLTDESVTSAAGG